MSETKTIVPDTKARVLIADDDNENAKLVEEALKLDGHQTRVCGDGEAALHLVRSWAPHAVLLDINMPKITGMEALKKIRSLSGGEYVGVILVTANSNLSEIIQGLDSGADDYIVKPYRVDELRARVRACLRLKGLHDALRRANKRLEDAAAHDDLTGLFNMRYSMKRMEDEVDKAKKNRLPISCAMFDMDHFKQVNDKNDHLFGSHVLREVAQIIQQHLRPGYFASRYGGDEYFVAMPGATIQEAAEVAERMRKGIEANVFKAGSYTTRCTASFGVSGTMGATDISMLDARELMRTADSALYSAKNSGRNRTEVYQQILSDALTGAKKA